MRGGIKKNFVKRERTTQEKITRLEKVKRSRVCFVLHWGFLCSDNYITFIHILYNIMKFKAKKLFQNVDADLSWLLF